MNLQNLLTRSVGSHFKCSSTQSFLVFFYIICMMLKTGFDELKIQVNIKFKSVVNYVFQRCIH